MRLVRSSACGKAFPKMGEHTGTPILDSEKPLYNKDQMSERKIVLVSACLVGINCRYDGTNKRDLRVLDYLKNKIAVPVCPELFTGLGIPRTPAEIEFGDGYDVLSGKARVLLQDGRDFSREFLNGARQALKIAELAQVSFAILKENSPTCGVNFIYHKGKLVRGTGIFTALLIKQGIAVASEKELLSKT